ncbi:MAG: 16S rRNA (cytosine(1402)-N(4))-methyltransferase RsmH [Candidatus Levybacteria bacterium]|nr:16S rRNA (cytosine(1402)-N(4))-methyltransferase RsmH [Candidatus Levybacteria bacterium]
MSSKYHIPILLSESLTFLGIDKGKKYVDATLGGGGHSLAIAKLGASVLGIDTDHEAVNFVKNEMQNIKVELQNKIVLTKGNFRDVKEIAEANEFSKVDGVLFDLGVSSNQLDKAERGFSFMKDGPLDMRMNSDLEVMASDLVHGLSKKELVTLFRRFGEERYANIIAGSIVKNRQKSSLKTTKQLADLIVATIGRRQGDIHPATLVFQALRIAINDELNSIELGLNGALEIIKSKGKIVVITFHSLEDKIVKQKFSLFADSGIGIVLTKKPIIPKQAEINNNPRSRSAKLRVFEKN